MIKSVNVTDKSNVIGISGTNDGNENITRVDFLDSTLNKLPQILFDTFSNLKELAADGVYMTNLDRLTNCSKLIYLDLFGNQIQAIKKSTFKECANLKRIWLDYNSITNIDQDAFDGLNELTDLQLSNT